MECPKCGLINPDGAQRCDCGYDFQSKRKERSYLEGTNETKPRSYLALAIATTFCFCLPLGIAAIVFSAQVEPKWAARDYNGSRAASRNARNLSIAAIVLGVLGATVSIVMQFALKGMRLNNR